MKLRFCVCLALTAALFAMLSMAGEMKDSKERVFDITLLPGFEMTEESPVEDFVMYRVLRSGTNYLSIYVGNQPAFPKQKEMKDAQCTRLKCGEVEILTRWQGALVDAREVLCHLKGNTGWPQFLHAWTSQLDLERVKDADRILMSITVR